jgi:hypothetical protein
MTAASDVFRSYCLSAVQGHKKSLMGSVAWILSYVFLLNFVWKIPTELLWGKHDYETVD